MLKTNGIMNTKSLKVKNFWIASVHIENKINIIIAHFKIVLQISLICNRAFLNKLNFLWFKIISFTNRLKYNNKYIIRTITSSK